MDQRDRIAAQREAQRTCWQKYMSRVSQGAKADGSSCGPALGGVPRIGVCLGMDGRGSGCDDDPDSAELPYFKLERRAVKLQDVDRLGTAEQARSLRGKVDSLEVTLSGMEVEGLRNAQRTLVALSTVQSVHTNWLALEAARLEQAYVPLKREISAIRALDSRLAGLRAEYDRLRQQADSAARAAATLGGKAKQLRSDLEKASAALSTDASRADAAMAATRRLNGADRAGYEAMASNEDLLPTFSQNMTRMRTTADGLFATMQDLTDAKAHLLEVSTSKATLAFEIKAVAEESRRRHAAADAEQVRLDALALALARNRDEQLAAQRAERLRTSQALQAGACSRTLRRVPE